jgi:DNA topoisomerase-6 subunit B
VREIKLGLQECARRLAHYLQRERALLHEYEQRAYIEKYLPHIGLALQDILGLDDKTRDGVVARLDDALHASRAAKRRTP